MHIGLLQEGDFKGTSTSVRYHEMIREAVRAEELGFSTWGTSEQHFSPPHFSVAAPEVLYAAVAAHTSEITLRNMSAVLVAYNHPILVAERMATLDIVSHGRAELCTARSNNLHTLEGFGVSPEDTQAQWAESLEILLKAWTQEVVEHDGRFWKVPPRTVVPKPYQDPHPAISVAVTSTGSHQRAGGMGLGIISYDNYLGFDYLQDCIDAYYAGREDRTPVGSRDTDYVGYYVPSPCCASTRAKAFDVAGQATLDYFGFIVDLYKPISKKPGYEYMARLAEIEERGRDLQWLAEATPSVMIGTPDDFIERLKRLEDMGVDEVLLRVDAFGHERNLEVLEMIGRHVIPEFSAGPLRHAATQG
jgi:alkanesulfonate monooxygenase SsuD/methylene tetrahydromethanopterin reductase-like flavin-dependent oxidoreductase (luciferase family)